MVESTTLHDPEGGAGSVARSEFDVLQARLDALRVQFGDGGMHPPAVHARPAPAAIAVAPTPAPVPAPEVVVLPASDPSPGTSLWDVSSPQSGRITPFARARGQETGGAEFGRSVPMRARSIVSRAVSSARSLRTKVTARSSSTIPGGPRARIVARRGLVLASAAVFWFFVVLLIVRSDDGASSGGSTASGSNDVAPQVDFPPATGASTDAVARVRPVAVRNVAIGFEAALEAVVELPACDELEVGAADSAAWFDAAAVTPDAEVVAVAPGEAGTALLRVRASDRVPEPFGATSVGQLVEVARVNGTVLGWDVVAIVDVPAGAPFPVDLLAPGADPRLVLVACGATVDRFVLTVPTR